MTQADGLAGSGLLADPGLQTILALLNRDGEEARIVGGAVRNALLGHPVSDIDIATTAVPGEVLRRAAAARLHAVPTGIEHGTITLIVHRRPYEVTTLREDIETDGRRAVVRFGRDFTKDAARRDFTMNALYASADGALCDEVGGLADLEAKRVRFIGEPARRIAEDALRILRFLRFTARYGDGQLDPTGMQAVIVARAALDTLSRERVRTELLKLLIAPHAVPVIIAAAESGLMDRVLGGVAQTARLAAYVATEARAGAPADGLARLLALAVLIEEDIERLRARLRLSNGERQRALTLLFLRQCLREGAHAAIKESLYRYPSEAGAGLRLAEALNSFDHPASVWAEASGLAARWRAPAFQIGGKDLLAAGIAKGPRMGEVLAAAERAWIAADFPTSETAQRALLASLLARGA